MLGLMSPTTPPPAPGAPHRTSVLADDVSEEPKLEFAASGGKTWTVLDLNQ